MQIPPTRCNFFRFANRTINQQVLGMSMIQKFTKTEQNGGAFTRGTAQVALKGLDAGPDKLSAPWPARLPSAVAV